jgi:hypothetical protein
MNFAAFLASMTRPLVAKVLMALGFSVVTITGVTASVDTLQNLFMTHMGAVPTAGLQLALLGGAGEGFGLIMGAIATRLALWQIQNGTKILGLGS